MLLGGASAALLACAPRGEAQPRGQSATTPATTVAGLGQIARDAAAEPTQAATPTPSPVPAAGVSERTLLDGTASETRAVISHSGIRGRAVMVLGGVHGNEPGGWSAADEVAAWAPSAGSLIVIPRANVQAIAGFVRTTDGIGDLNRLYPGNLESAFLMERMAATIVAIAKEFGVSLLLDMHESWAFYREYPAGGGTGALGQTVTVGAGPLGRPFGDAILARVNPAFSAREEMLIRDGSPFARPPDATPSPGTQNRGRSSLSVGGYVPGLTPILVEMGQENQPQSRRVELHLIVARAVLELAGVV